MQITKQKAIYVITAKHERVFVEFVPENVPLETWVETQEDLLDTLGFIGAEEEVVEEN